MTFKNNEIQSGIELNILNLENNIESNIENIDKIITFYSNLDEKKTNKITDAFDNAFA